MAKAYGPKPPKGQIERELEKLGPDERRVRKAEVFASLKSGSFTFQRDNIRFTLSNWERKGNVFRVHATAADSNGALPLHDTDNPFEFVNPPLMVPTGTWRKENVNGQEVDVPNVEESPLEALRIIVFEAVTTRARARGWRP